MSSGSRNELLESLLAAKYDLDCCEDKEKAEMMAKLERVIQQVLVEHPTISRNDLLEGISDRYREYRAARIRAQRRRDSV